MGLPSKKNGCHRQGSNSLKNPGCKDIYSCCNQAVNSSGCIEVCRKCGGKWGTNAKNCFKKNHNVVPIEIEDSRDEKLTQVISRLFILLKILKNSIVNNRLHLEM